MITVRRMTDADVPLLLRLRALAGWNQTEADLRRYLALQGDGGGFVAALDGAEVGTAMTFVFGPVAWVAMVLVDPAVRNRGVGTALMEHALAHLDSLGLRCVRLDATPLGQPIYEKLGFVAQDLLYRYDGVLGAADDGPDIAAPTADDWPALLALDRAVTGADREPLLRRLFEDFPDSFRALRSAAGVGFVGWRAGRDASMIGPCLASDETTAIALLQAACRHLAGRRVFLDVFEGHDAAVRFARGRGLTPQRPLLRMARGDNVRDDVTRLWASAGPAVG